MNPPDLPIGWCAFTDEKTQRTYYAHIPTGNVRWDPPPSIPPPPPPMPPTHPVPPPPPRTIQQAPLQTDSSYTGFVTPSSLAQNFIHPSVHHHANNSGMYHRISPQADNTSFRLPAPPMHSLSSHFEPRGLKRPRDYHEHNFVKRQYHGLTSNDQNQVKQTHTDQLKKCSQCKTERGRDHFSKKQWCKKYSERKCKHCVEIHLGVERQGATRKIEETADTSAEKVQTGGTTSDVSLSLEKVSPNSSLTDEPLPPMTAEQNNDRCKICCVCKKERDWVEFSKTQWMAPAFSRKCKVCIDEKRNNIRQEKEKLAETLLMLAEVPSHESKTKEDSDPHQLQAQDDAELQQPNNDVIEPELVPSVPFAENHANTTELRGILKNSPETAPLNNNAIKEENTEGSLLNDNKQANHNPTLSRVEHIDKPQDLFLSEKRRTRLCSCCNKECPWDQYTKTQWLMSSKFRKCKSCIVKDPNMSESEANISGKKTRRVYEESGDELRKCAMCNVEKTWNHFSKRQWTAFGTFECVRKCRLCAKVEAIQNKINLCN